MSALIIDQDEYALRTVYAPITFTASKDDIETRYVLIGVRTFVNPNDPKDVKAAHALQDAIKVEQAGIGTYQAPNWDSASRDKVREDLIKCAAGFTDSRGMFGPRGKVDPERHLIGAASGWGGNAENDALYLTLVPPKNDGKTVHRMTIKPDVPVDAFWSISVYGADGYFHKNDQDSYSINNVTAKKDADGSVTITLAAVAVIRPTACLLCPTGITGFASTARAKKFSTAVGSFPKRSRNDKQRLTTKLK